LRALGPGLNLDKEACEAIEEIFLYTGEKAPFLLGRVKELIVQFIKYRESVHDFLPGLERQIELESSGKLVIQLDSRPISIPQEFRDEYKNIFPDIYRQIYLNLADKDKVPEALVEVFVEFLVQEQSFKKMERHHMPLLKEIVDRTSARFNGQKLADFVPMDSSEVEIPDFRKIRINDDILKSVEQELFKLVQAEALSGVN